LLWVSNVGVFKRGVSPSFQNCPPLLDKERGTKGVRSPYIIMEEGDRFINKISRENLDFTL